MTPRWRAWLMAFAAALAPLAARSEPLKLDPADTAIVLSPRAERAELDAAAMLQTWLRKAAHADRGFDLQILEQGTGLAERAAANPRLGPNDKVSILVGKTFADDDPRLQKLNDDGFLIRREGRKLTIAGRTADATYLGAVEFLNRYAGVRFYMPTAFWTSLPASPEIIHDGPDIVSQPFVTSCSVSGVTNAQGDGDWLRRIGGARRKGGTHQHNLFFIFPPAKFAAPHPEIYPVYDGKRHIPENIADQTWQICFTEPATLEAAKQSIAEYFKAEPRAAYIAVSVNDGGRWSETPRDQEIIAAFKARDPQGDFLNAATSDIYWRFMNQLAAWMKEACPGKLLVGLAYGPTRVPPVFKLEDNIVVFANLHVSELIADKFMDRVDGRPPLLTQWLDVANHFGNHEWYEGNGFLLPRIYSGFWTRFMQALDARLPDAFIHCEAYPNWGMDGPKYYLAAKIWWDPQADTEALLRQFCDDMFGPASAAMADYFNEQETLWTALDNTEGPERKLHSWATQFVTTPASRTRIARCRELLDKAASLAQTTDQKARVALFSQCFAFSESLFDLAAAPADPARRDRAAALARQVSSNPWALYRGETAMTAVQVLYKGPAANPPVAP